LRDKLCRHAGVKESIDNLVRVLEPLVGGKARYHLIQYGFHRADAVVAPAENGRSLLIIQSDALTEALLDGVDFRAQRLQRIDRQV
jgi:hypothetical protein